MQTAVNRKLYEGMFLVDSAQAANWDETKATIEDILKRGDSEIVELKKWDDRQLAYEIDRKGRGTYILCYFNADCEKINAIEKGVQLSEKILRVLILSTEQMTADDIAKDTPTMKAEREAATAEEARVARIADAEAKAKEALDQVAAEGSDATAESSSVEAVAVTVDAEAKVEEAVAVAVDAETTEEVGEVAPDSVAKVEEDVAVPIDIGTETAAGSEASEAVEGSDVVEASAEGESEDPKEQDAP